MAWDQLWLDKPHITYAIIGVFSTLFGLVSYFIKNRLYVGEATVAVIFGIIVGPHALNWLAPDTWGNTDFITLEFSRILVIVQVFAVGLELPAKYFWKQWRSLVMILFPVMIFGWLLSSVFIWQLVPSLGWVEGLAIASTVTATDPVLSAAILNGQYARQVSKRVRDLLSAESACNDGLVYPFAYLAICCIKYTRSTDVAFHFIVMTVLYECVFAVVLGCIIGFVGRHAVRFAYDKELLDNNSLICMYLFMSILCTGFGTILGIDDFLVSFSAGCSFGWDGWVVDQNHERSIIHVLDYILNILYFVYFGSVIPWEQYNTELLSAWRLAVMAILILLFRRIPALLAIKKLTPNIHSWSEALFCGHFGPIGVAGLFISLIVKAELEHGEPTPEDPVPGIGSPHGYAIATIWPITTFLVVSSMLVHGLSIPLIVLFNKITGRRPAEAPTLTLTESSPYVKP